MPLYFILSGLFFKSYGGVKNFFIKKINLFSPIGVSVAGAFCSCAV